MSRIVNAEVERYIRSLRDTDGHAVRGEMEERAERWGFPIVGPEVGRLLALLTRLSAARRVLELGSGFGYSAWWFASALPEGGTVLCTDTSAEYRELALDYLGRSGLAGKVRFRVGEALQILDALEESFDIIFNDIDKEAYPQTIAAALDHLEPGGLFITDNTLWQGRVAAAARQDGTTRAVDRFNRLIVGHPQLETVILPIRDGLSICRKRRESGSGGR